MNEDIRLRIGQRIAELRQKKGLSLRQLSEISGVGFAHISRIEQGKYSVGVDIVAKLAEALGAELKIE